MNADDFPTIRNTEKSTTTPRTAIDVAKNSKLPTGFEMSVFASEPDVQNPIAMTTDDRGRIWVAENYSWSGNGAGGFDGNQRDRIVILEDVDGDGTHDKRTVFWDEARKLTSIEVGHGGVWALCLPNLIFIPDRNRDDIPDSAPRIVLNGFDEAAVGHTPANGLKWGPDGWLYARHGIQATSNIGKPDDTDSQRVKINTGVWRYHPIRNKVEPMMYGMTNAWGFDFDQHGEMFVINTVIGHLWHVVPGAHVRRMYGVDLNPHVYQLIEQTADHVHWDTGEQWNTVQKGMSDKTNEAGGGHAHIGLMIYQGDNWPEEYRHRLFTLNLHGLRINSNSLVRDNAGYTGKRAPDFCFFSDPWFRGMEMITGPDGGVFVADWSDTGECHDHDGVHRTSGRIYKLTYGKTTRVASLDLSKSSDAELIAMHSRKNAWWPRMARRVLADRYHKIDSPRDQTVFKIELMRALLETDDVAQRLRLMETLFEVNGTSEGFLVEQLGHPDEHIRVAALRFLFDRPAANGNPPSPSVLSVLKMNSRRDTSGLFALYLTSVLQKMPVANRWPLAEELIRNVQFAEDRMYPSMLWYGIEEAVARDPVQAIALLPKSGIPLVTENIARRLTVEIDSEGSVVEKLLTAASQKGFPYRERVLAGMAKALNGWQRTPQPKNWPAFAEQFKGHKDPEIGGYLQSLQIVFGDGRAAAEIEKLVMDNAGEAEARRQALRSLVAGRTPNLAPQLIKLLGDRVMLKEAIIGLASYDHPETPKQLFSKLKSFGPAERAAAIQTLASRPGYAKALMGAIRNKQIASAEISAFYARQIRSFEDEELTRDLTELWGDVRLSNEEKRKRMDEWRNTLTAQELNRGDLNQGRALFQKNCANCHVLYGVGRKVGPDLTGSNRKNIDYLLENIVDPSASVGADFRTLIVLLDDGQVINGAVIEKSERTITLQTAQEPITLDIKRIAESKQSSTSIMPDGLLQNLDKNQVRDLFAYLMGSTP
ncbi:MAG: PVC-type heme-binding CxxCH protein [Pirellula sp.]